MSEVTKQADPTMQKIRLFPGVIIVILLLVIRYGMPIFMPGATTGSLAMLGGLAGGLAMMVWWMFFSRAPRFDRWAGVILIIAAMTATFFFMHPSIKTAMMGLMYPMVAMPGVSLAFILWVMACRHLSDKPRRVLLVVTVLISCSLWTLTQSKGITGVGGVELTWRWTATAEEQFLVESQDEPTTIVPAEGRIITDSIWPGFRGSNRDSIIHGTTIATDWSTSPPAKLWARKIGPGCSSFAVKGSLIYTQEQRGKYEMVTCYNIYTGKLVWKHRDKERFYDSHAGAGPRSTPTLNKGQVFTFGPTGILNVLNDQDGKLVWSRNVGVENKVKLPIWALTSSPLVVDDLVIVATEGRLLAFDRATGEPRWQGPDGGKGYSSPHLVTIDGVKQVLLMSSAGTISVNAADGKVFWEYKWPKGERIVQPALMENGDLLIASGEGMAVRRISVKQSPDGWTTTEKWTSSELKPSFNDFVVHQGHVYGFDAPAVVSINGSDGKLNWRGGRYGGGQLMLLTDQDLLMVISEKGDLALVMAKPEKYVELGRIKGIEGKVWNHPVLVGDMLLLRNAQDMVAYKLALKGN